MFAQNLSVRDRKNNPLWFQEVVQDHEHRSRIQNVLDIKTYLLRQHKILLRENFSFKEEEFVTAKIILNIIKSVLNSHVSYLIGQPCSLNGDNEVVSLFNKISKKGGYDKINYEVVKDLYTYGNAFEYVYEDNGIIKSKIIANEDSFPVYDYDATGTYSSFVEHWKDSTTHDEHYIVYYPERVETYKNSELLSTKVNLSGLPIHYSSIDKSEFNHFGEPFANDLIEIINAIESLISKMVDGVTVHSLSPIAVSLGKNIESKLDANMIGGVISYDDGDFKYATAQLDHDSIKLLLDNLWAQFYAIACIPATSMGQMNIANVSETSLRLLYAKMHEKATETTQALKEGMFKRFDYIRKLLALSGKTISDDAFDTLDICFNVNRPVDTYSLMEELQIQRDMNAISIKSIVDQSPYTVDVATELERLEEEKRTSNDGEEE